MSKKGPTFIIPCNRAQDLAKLIDDFEAKDQELINLADYLRSFQKGAAYVCMAEEDFLSWSDGPDIRDFQLGGRNQKTMLIHRGNVYSNDPDDLES